MARPDAPADRPLLLDPNLQIIFTVTWTAMMGVGSLSPVFPSVMEAFQVSSQEVGLLITAFTLPGIFLSPVTGLLADRYGRKQVLVPSLLLFAFAGLGCAFAPSFEMLLALRALQGCGGAALQALNNTIIGDLYTGRARLTAVGYNASVQNLATLTNPLLGGLVALAGWYFPFYLPLLAVPVACFVAFHLKSPPRTASRQSLAQYVGRAFKVAGNRSMVALFTANVVSVMISFGVLMVYLSLLMKERFDANPLEIGIVVASSSIIATFVSTQAARLNRLMTQRQMIVVGFVISAAGVALNPFVPAMWLLLLPALLKGISQGITQPPLYTLLLEGTPADARAGIMALNGSLYRVGQTIAPLLFALVYTLGGLDAVFEAGAVMLLGAGAVVWLLLDPRMGERGKVEN